MKRIYKIILGVIGIEYLYIIILNKFNVKIDSVIGTILGVALFFAPIIILFFLLGKDEEVDNKYRILVKVLNVCILACCLVGFVIKILGLED